MLWQYGLIYTLITKLGIENVIINVKYVFQGSNWTFLSWISVRRWKIGSNQPDKGGSYCDSHTHACPSAFPDLGEDEDEDGCDNDDDDDGYGDDGDDFMVGLDLVVWDAGIVPVLLHANIF